MNKIKSILFFFTLLLLTFGTAKALTYQEIMNGQTQGQVLGASTPVFINSSSTSCASNTVCNLTYSPTAGNLLVVTVRSVNATDSALAGVSDNQSSSYVQDANSKVTGNHIVAIFHSCSVKSGVTTITANSTHAAEMSIGVTEYSGVAASNCLDQISAVNTGNTSPVLTNALTPATSGELSVGIMMQMINGSSGFGNTGGYSCQNFADSMDGDMVAHCYNVLTTTASNQATAIFNPGSTWFSYQMVFFSGTSSPTPTPTVTPTPTPTGTPTPTPTITPTPSPTPTPSGNNIYIAQSAAGSGNGSSCANALATSFFNTSSNWTSSPASGKISPATTVHLCGTFSGAAGSTMLTTQGSGTNGNPITILFESGSVFTAPYWGATGAIHIVNDYVTVDGGANGIIQNTLNGTSGGACLGGACSQQQPSDGVMVGTIGSGTTASHVIIQNLHITNIYVHTEDINDAAGDNSTGIELCGSNELMTGNTITNVYSGIALGCTNQTNIEYSFNTISKSNHSLKIAINSGTVTGVKMHDNDISDAYVWDEPDNHYHHNGIFAFGDPAGTITGQYYNNYIHGIFSRDTAYGASHTTALIFLEYDNANSQIFNNVFALSSGDLYGVANGLITIGGSSGPQYVYNNTFYETRDNGDQCVRGGGNSLDLRNNIFVSCGLGVFWTLPAPTFTANYNIYYGLHGANAWWWNTDAFINFTTWKSDCGCDLNSTNGVNPNLSASFQPNPGSPALAAGANLTSLGIVALNIDKAGTVRPTSAAWDIGAYQVSSGGGGGGTPVPGDLNLDHVVNSLDFSLLNSKWFQIYPSYDLNGDKFINSLDFAIMASNWGKTW